MLCRPMIKNVRLIVAKIVYKTLKALNMNYPINDEQRELELKLFKQKPLKQAVFCRPMLCENQTIALYVEF